MIFRTAALLALLASSALAAPPAIRIQVNSDEYTQTLTYDLSEGDARSIESVPRRAEEYVNRARSDFAEALGYTKKRFGEQNWKVVTGLRIAAVDLVTDRRTVPLRSVDDVHDDNDAGSSEPAAPAEPPPAPEPPASEEDGGE